ncbi:MAG: hypothetical protein COA88_12955 [Kordia sp.]|nr:MAG: hypothetical protein COA88_12955 [Kordia sp.]
MKDFKKISSQLAGFKDADYIYSKRFIQSVYTEGFNTFMNLTECNWIYDIIEIDILLKALRGDLPKGTYNLRFKCSGKFVQLILMDNNNETVWVKGFSSKVNFLTEITFIVRWNGDCLTSCLEGES